jgi:hypothetical protein
MRARIRAALFTALSVLLAAVVLVGVQTDGRRASAVPAADLPVLPPAGSVSLFAGGDGAGAATGLSIQPTAITATAQSLYIAETSRFGFGLIRRVDRATGATTIVAGSSRPWSYDRTPPLDSDLPATEVGLPPVTGMAVQPDGALLLVANGSPYRLGTEAGSRLVPLARDRTCGPCALSGQFDGPNNSAMGIALLSDGRVAVGGKPVRVFGTDGRVTSALDVVSVDANYGDGMRHYENVPGVSSYGSPTSIDSDGAGGFVYTEDRGTFSFEGIRRVDAAGRVSTLLSTGPAAYDDPAVPAARRQEMPLPVSVRRESDGNLLILLEDGQVRRLRPDGTSVRLAGGGSQDSSVPGPALGANLAGARLLASDGAGGFFVDAGIYAVGSDAIRHVDAAGQLTTVAGNSRGYGGDGGPAVAATFGRGDQPPTLAAASDGTVYVGDENRHVIRAIDPLGTVRTIAGQDDSGIWPASGDGGPALAARIDLYNGIAADVTHTVYLNELTSIRKVNSAGIITTIVDSSSDDKTSDQPAGLPVASLPGSFGSVTATDDGRLYFIDFRDDGARLIRLDPTGTTTELATSVPGTRITVSNGTVYAASDSSISELQTDGTWSTYADLPHYLPYNPDTALGFDAASNGALFVSRNYSGTVRVDPDGRQVRIGSPDGRLPRADEQGDPGAASGLAGFTPGVLVGNDLVAGSKILYRAYGVTAGSFPPSRPLALTSAPADGAIDIGWEPPTIDGGSAVTAYLVTVTPGNASTTVGADARSARVGGLANGTSYTATVQAINAQGRSLPETSPPVQPAPANSRPGAPQAVLAEPLPNAISVNWLPPALPGSSDITGYSVHASTGATVTVTGQARQATVPAAAGQPVTATVTATNASGPGAASAVSGTVRPATNLDPATNIRLLPHPQGVTVVWDNPVTVAGHPIALACAAGSSTQWGICPSDGTTAATISDPVFRSDHFQVRAATDVSAAAGATSGYASPIGGTAGPAPLAPANATGSASPGTVTATWTPPADGSTPTNYIATLLPEGRALVLPPTARSTNFSGLSAGEVHRVAVRADGDGGVGPGTTTGAVTVPATPPPPPPPPAPTPPPVLSGAATRVTTYGSTVALVGTAQPGARVGVWLRKAGATTFVQRQTVTASSTGAWSAGYVADNDYRVYATVGTAASQTILVQVAPTIAGATTRMVRRNSTYVITGTGTPGATLTVHFHKAGTAANDYSIVRTTTIAANGGWSRSYVAAVDYRFFVSLPNGCVSPAVLVQAR